MYEYYKCPLCRHYPCECDPPKADSPAEMAIFPEEEYAPQKEKEAP
mgnify:CR=1 FL=1|jgi:hypothetical protein